MKVLILICACCLMVGCASNVKVINPDGEEWVVENAPPNGEVTFEETDGEDKAVKITVKKHEEWNPLKPLYRVVSGAIALVFNRTDLAINAD